MWNLFLKAVAAAHKVIDLFSFLVWWRRRWDRSTVEFFSFADLMAAFVDKWTDPLSADKLFFLRRLQHISSSCLSNTSRESSILWNEICFNFQFYWTLVVIRAARQSQISYFALATYTLPVVMMRDDIAAMKCLLVKWKLRKSRFQLIRKKWACWYRMPKQARIDKTVSMSCVFSTRSQRLVWHIVAK